MALSRIANNQGVPIRLSHIAPAGIAIGHRASTSTAAHADTRLTEL